VPCIELVYQPEGSLDVKLGQVFELGIPGLTWWRLGQMLILIQIRQ
jgi:hypothetical protein